MARDNLPLTAFTLSLFSEKPTMTAINTTNGMKVPVEGDTQNLLLMFTAAASGSSAAGISIKAGDNPPAFRSGLGDVALAFSGSAASGNYFVTAESARCVQSDVGFVGYLFIDFDSVVSGSAAAFRLPKGV